MDARYDVGKGSKERPVDRDRYRKNYDKIFRKKEKEKEVKK